MPSAKKEVYTNQFLIYLIVLLILGISAFSIKNYLDPTKVLGASSQSLEDKNDLVFWNEFLSNNPNYIPGWIEIGRMDKVKEIDPNYE